MATKYVRVHERSFVLHVVCRVERLLALVMDHVVKKYSPVLSLPQLTTLKQATKLLQEYIHSYNSDLLTNTIVNTIERCCDFALGLRQAFEACTVHITLSDTALLALSECAQFRGDSRLQRKKILGAAFYHGKMAEVARDACGERDAEQKSRKAAEKVKSAYGILSNLAVHPPGTSVMPYTVN